MKRLEDFRIPRPRSARQAFLLRTALILFIGLTALQAFPLLSRLRCPEEEARLARETETAHRMRRAMEIIVEEREKRGYPADPATDPNRSGLIGHSWSELTTTPGSLPAKRSAAQPAAAVLLQRMIMEAGAGPGDAVAVDSSGSFPGFAIAAAIACESIGADCILIVSIGSSTWGANLPGFTLADMIGLLHSEGLIARGLAGVSPGGADDSGSDMDGPVLERALSRALHQGASIIRGPELETDIEARRAVFESQAEGRPISAFISIGGNYPATGGEEFGNGILSGNGGLGAAGPSRVSGKFGMVQHFLAQGIPVIRILDIKGLAARTGLPWDPLPWPADPGMPPPTDPRATAIRRLIAGLTLALAFASLLAGMNAKKKRCGSEV